MIYANRDHNGNLALWLVLCFIPAATLLSQICFSLIFLFIHIFNIYSLIKNYPNIKLFSFVCRKILLQICFLRLYIYIYIFYIERYAEIWTEGDLNPRPLYFHTVASLQYCTFIINSVDIAYDIDTLKLDLCTFAGKTI